MFLEKEIVSLSETGTDISSSDSSAFLPIDLPALIENLKHAKSWQKGELNAIILLKTPVKKIVLTIMHPETEVRSIQSDDSLTFQIIEGKLKLHIGNESLTLTKGELLTLREKTRYTIVAIEESALLLTLNAGNDS
jgi:mannose-6-phosphate isomerase-like protein (cupin superfamily)